MRCWITGYVADIGFNGEGAVVQGGEIEIGEREAAVVVDGG